MKGAIVFALSLVSSGCTIDSKGNVCGIIGILSAAGGDQYCRDEGAEADCEVLNDAMVDAAVLCAGGALDDDEARAALAGEGGVLEDCSAAGATTNELVECEDALSDTANPPCDGADFEKPDVCRNVVLDSIFSDNLPG